MNDSAPQPLESSGSDFESNSPPVTISGILGHVLAIIAAGAIPSSMLVILFLAGRAHDGIDLDWTWPAAVAFPALAALLVARMRATSLRWYYWYAIAAVLAVATTGTVLAQRFPVPGGDNPNAAETFLLIMVICGTPCAVVWGVWFAIGMVREARGDAG